MNFLNFSCQGSALPSALDRRCAPPLPRTAVLKHLARLLDLLGQGLLPYCTTGRFSRSLAGYLTGGKSMAGWVRGPSLGENQLATLRNAQQVFLPLMEYDDFSSPLHEVSRGDPLALRPRSR